MQRKIKAVYLILVLSIALSGCGNNSDNDTINVPGKFAVTSVRDGKTIKDKKVYIVKDGKITHELGSGANPVWSRDGKYIVFVALNDPILHIYDVEHKSIKSINTIHYPSKYDWTIDSNAIVYGAAEFLNDKYDAQSRIYMYHLDSKERKLIHKLDYNQKVIHLYISPNGDKVAFYAGNPFKLKTPKTFGIIDLNSSNLKELKVRGAPTSWLSDGEHIAIISNTRDDGEKYNDAYGILGKVNVHTDKITTIKNMPGFYMNLRMSRDGKYFMYPGADKSNKQVIIIESVETGERRQATTATRKKDGQYSADFDADWYLPEL